MNIKFFNLLVLISIAGFIYTSNGNDDDDNISSNYTNLTIRENIKVQSLIDHIKNNNGCTKNFVRQFITNYPRYINNNPENIVYFQKDLTLAHFLIRRQRIDILEILIDRGEMLYGQDHVGMTPFLDFCYFIPPNRHIARKQNIVCYKILNLNENVLRVLDPYTQRNPYYVVSTVTKNKNLLNIFDQHHDENKKNLEVKAATNKDEESDNLSAAQMVTNSQSLINFDNQDQENISSKKVKGCDCKNNLICAFSCKKLENQVVSHRNNETFAIQTVTIGQLLENFKNEKQEKIKNCDCKNNFICAFTCKKLFENNKTKKTDSK